MRWIVTLQRIIGGTLLAFAALWASAQPVFGATSVVIKNEGPASVQIGFDGGQSTTIAPRGTARLSLESGEHTAQCRFEGSYDGCNLDQRFTIGNGNVNMSLRPVLTLQNAVGLAQRGTLAVETRADAVWATNTLEIAGSIADCADYETGKLGTVASRVRPRAKITNLTVVTLNLCGERQNGVGAVVNGQQLYFHPRFLMFKDATGRPVLVR